MAKIDSILFSGNARTGAVAPKMSFAGAESMAASGRSIARGLNDMAGGFIDRDVANYRESKIAEAKLRERKAYDDHLWTEQRLTEAQRKWIQWTQDVQKNGSEDVITQFEEGYKKYQEELMAMAPNPEAKNLLKLKLDDLGTNLFESSLKIEAANRSRNTIATFQQMLTESTDMVAQAPEMYAMQQQRLKSTLDLSLKMKRISPEIGIKVQAEINELAAQAAEAMVSKNPERAREILDSSKGIAWNRRKAILSEIERAQETNTTLNNYQQKELAESSVISMMETGKVAEGFNLEAYAATFPEKTRDAAKMEINAQIDAARQAFVGKTEMQGKSAVQISEVLGKYAPKAGDPDFATKSRTYRYLSEIADNQMKLLKGDPFSYARQDPIVDGAWDMVEQLPQDATPAIRNQLTQQALTASANFQRSLGIPEGNISVMSVEQARTIASQINNGKVDQVQQTFNSLIETYGPHYQTAFRDLVRLPEGQRIDAASQVVALHIGRPFLADFISAIRTPDKDFGIEASDKRAINERLATNGTFMSFSSAVLSGNPGAISYVDDFNRAISKYATSLYARGKAKSPDEAVTQATELIIGSAYGFTEVSGSTVAIKRNVDGATFNDDDIEIIGQVLRDIPSGIDTSFIDTKQFSFPGFISDKIKEKSIRDTLVNDTFWVTNPQNTGAILFMNGLEGSTAPVKWKTGEPVELNFKGLRRMGDSVNTQLPDSGWEFRQRMGYEG